MRISHPLLAPFTFFLYCLCSLYTSAQTIHPSDNLAFLQNEVATVRITLSADSLAAMLHPDNLESNHEYPATFIYQSSSFADTMLNIGFRLRGNTSRYADKKSFKVSFNTFLSGNKWLGLEKMNLNGEHNDPSILRSWLSAYLLRENGSIAPRNSYIKLYINNEYKGLYYHAEHIDEEFIQLRFPGDDDGNLYKPQWGADLTFLGSNPANYATLYELKTNTSQNDYSGLVQFITTLNQTSTEDFPCVIQQIMDVEIYLRALAVELLSGQWDGYSYNKNNYYLYQRPSDGKFIFIQYDMDNTFGVDWMNENWATRPIFNWSHPSQPRPLYQKMMAVPYFRDRLSFHIDSLLNGTYTQANLTNLLQVKQNLISSAALADVYREMDYGFDDNDFLNAITQAWGGHVTTSLSSFILNRSSSAAIQTNYQGLSNPCQLGLDEDIQIQNGTDDFYNLLGQPVVTPKPNEVYIQRGIDGRYRKVLMVE
jgi:spore coat protein H